MTTKPTPKLDSRILKNPESLSRVLGEFVESDVRQQRHRRRIIRLQRELQGLVTAEAWRVYLRLEEATAVRLGDATDLVAMWAFKQGRRNR